MSNDKLNQIGEIIKAFQEKCNPTYLNITNVYWDRRMTEEVEIEPEIHVEIEEPEDTPSNASTYCHPVAEFGREQGLFLWDTVTNWEEQTVRLRFRFEG